MIVVGLDPSLRNYGFARFNLNLATLKLDPISVDICKTESTKSKQVRKNSDDLERARLLHTALHRNLEGAGMAFCEVPVGSKSARAMASYGMSIGLLGSIQVPMVQLTPTEVKLAATGNKNATKEEMIAWATGLYPNLNWLRQGKRLTGANEHLADAVATIHAGLLTDQFKQAMAILRWAA